MWVLGGFKREELVGHTMEEYGLLVNPELKEIVERKLRTEGKASNIESKIRTKDGDTRTVLFSADPITIDNEPCLLVVSVDITEREKKASDLRLSEEKYRILVENSLRGLTIIQDSQLVFCNGTFAAMLGYSAEELLRSPNAINALVHPDDQAVLLGHYRDQLAGKPVDSRFEFQGIQRDGTVIWVEAYASVIEYNGRPAIQSVYMDITDRKKAADALRESEERFRLIADSIDEIFWIYDPKDKKETYISPAYDRIWGYPRERVVTNPEPFMMDMVHPEDRWKVEAGRKILDTGKPGSSEYRIIRPDGSIRNIWDRGYPVLGRDGRVKRIVGVAQDVTGWRCAEAALKDSKEYLNQIINCIGDPIFVKNREHAFTLVNDAMCAFIGAPREELLGVGEMPEAVAGPLWEQEEAVFETGRETLTEDEFPASQGGPRILMTKKTLLTDKGGNKQIVGVMRDITEYKRLEAQFLQSQKMEAVGVLAGGVAHDFNNLLNVINGYSEMMLESAALDESLRKDLEQIRGAGQRAATLTSQLLDFGRKQILQPEILDLNHLIADMSSMLRRLIGEDIELVSHAGSGPVMINADRGKIQQVVMNLVVNARDAMPNGGRLIIETAHVDFGARYLREHPMAKPGPFVMLAISDNGVGMDAATQARIFEPFFTTKAKGKGTGLGLSTVYGIVRQSDGFVWVYSEPGKGTTVKVYFPRAEGPVAEATADDRPACEIGGSETVLFAEDEAAVRALASRILSDRGYHVLEAADGMGALRISQEYAQKTHMVLTDVVMPGLSGQALVARLREFRPGIKALFISGYTDNAISHRGILDSNIDFLQKPFSVDGLIRKVREVLDS